MTDDALTDIELGSKTTKVASYVVFSKVYALIVAGASFLIVARLLGPTGYGVYALAISAASLIGALGSFGVDKYFSKHVPEHVAKGSRDEMARMLGDGIVFLVLAGLLFSVVGALVSGFVATYVFHGAASQVVLVVAMASIVFTAVSGALYGALIGFGDEKGSTLSLTSGTTTQAVLSVTLVLLGAGALGATTGWMLGTVATAVVAYFMLARKSRISVRPKGLFKRTGGMVRFSLPLAGAGMMTTLLSNFSVVYLGIFFLPAVVGAFGVANRIGAFIDVVTGTIGIVLIPMFSTALSHQKMKERMLKLYSYSVYFGFLFLTPLIIYFAVLSTPFVLTFFTASYASAALYTALISISVLIGFISTYGNAVMISMGEVRKVFVYTGIFCLAELVSLLILTPIYGAIGVIVAVSFIGNIACDALYIRHVNKTLGGDKGLGRLARLMAANIILAALFVPLLFINVWPLLLLIGGAAELIVIYPALLGATKALTKNESKILSTSSRGVPLVGPILSALLSYATLFMR